jgi:hypothetical protein
MKIDILKIYDNKSESYLVFQNNTIYYSIVDLYLFKTLKINKKCCY